MFLRRLRRRVPKSVKVEMLAEADDVHSKLDESDWKNSAEDNVPAIEHVASFESSSTLSSGVTSPRLPSLKVETIALVQRVIAEDESVETLEESSYGEPSPASSTASSTESQSFSKDTLETLLTSECLQDYNDLVEREEVEKQEEMQMRKRLLQQELDALLEATRADMESDGEELEPEAIEALGIAADRVSYLTKYYDVQSCKYTYVPSVASAVLDGSLLEEASKHYFGAKEEFLVSYAGSLGSIILRNQQPNALGVHDKEDFQDFFSTLCVLSPIPESPTNQAAPDLCWGVLPATAAKFGFRFQTPVQPSEVVRSRSGSKKNSVSAAIIGLLLGVLMVAVATNSTSRPWEEIMSKKAFTVKLFSAFGETSKSPFFSMYEELTTKFAPTNPTEISDSMNTMTIVETSVGETTSIKLAKKTPAAPVVPNLLYY